MAPPVPTPAPYPEKDAATVRKFARLTYNPALAALDLVKGMVGHPGNVQQAVNSWESGLHNMQDSLNDISAAKSEVAPQWVGGAAVAFTTYATTIETRISENSNGFTKAIESTMKMYSAVLNAYGDGIEFISKCAQAIFKLWGGLLSDAKAWVGGALTVSGIGSGAGLALIASHFTGLLSDMTENINGLVRNVIDATRDYNVALVEVRTGLAKVLPPPGFPGSLKRPGLWTP